MSSVEDISSDSAEGSHPMLPEQFFHKRARDITLKECLFCPAPHHNSNTQPSSLAQGTRLGSVVARNLSKYMTSKDFYNVKVVNDVIYNEQTHVVSIFKDYLIFDDISEFLKREYSVEES